ncbi:hypothetical protein [Flavobacterium lacus]|jgi:hypothetical protein|uniref:Uncharacterized protein n=1 Tax=Flavobacterium lacus TaxID=1353778 RepID=A0A328WM26_9FLAO|nr:hypothetical protein [Flavobacterium lacus]RAR47291.1 hypothetical protein B0I10_11085 [Flavobacterium lacus]
MKNKLLLILCFALIGIYSCSTDDDKSEVNFIRAKFNGVEQKFNIISVDIVDYVIEGYSDIEVTATMTSDATKTIVLKSEYGTTGDIIWGMYYTTDGTYYQNDENLTNSNVTVNSPGRYTGTFSGTLNSSTGIVLVTEGSFDIIY